MKIMTRRGFTLIEILVALVILSIALNAFYKTFSSTVNADLYLQDKTIAQFVGLNVIAEFELGLIDFSEQNTFFNGHETMSGSVWHWRAVLSATADPATSRIVVDVRKNPASTALVHLTGFLRKEIS